MAERNPSDRSDPVGSRSPASEEAQAQGEAGAAGARAAQTAGTGSQPAQASNRRDEGKEQEPQRRKGYEAGQAPSEQGDKEHPSPEVIAQHQQGIGRQSGNTAGRGDRSQERATE